MTDPQTAEAMAALHAECFTVPRPWSAAEFAAMIAEPHVLVQTAPGGLVLARVAADEAEILTLAVAPSARRLGIARGLLAQIHAAVLARQARIVFLEVAADNGAAIGLYTGAGYRESGRRRGYYTQPTGEKTDALVLSRGLGAL